VDYAERFSLGPHIRLNSDVRQVSRSDDQHRWEVVVAYKGGEEVVEYFHKVVLSTGINDVPCMPSVEGIVKFKGTVLHSNAYKRYFFSIFITPRAPLLPT